jgi:glycyl-tRNA synthetase
MSDHLSFQDIILRLLDYWKSRGCLVQQPYNVQVGAGTMNPATALRVLGPEPWNVVYVEPSIRPDDGRFGDNPNRMQMHHQLQVILKPDPGNPQELYLKSLEAIGIDLRKHDVRFVEDNWESPALGAWGLGWEVWLDGQEITQFTYFQQAGTLNLDPPCVEITYGLDRIILALQGKRSVWEINYNEMIPYGDVLLHGEIEHCHYTFHVADVEALRQVYDTYEREAQRCIEAGLVLPAHDYNLKCSHLFNVLDTRGAIGVTERANYFKRMRGIARQISELYVEQRQRLEYPLLDRPWTLAQEETTSADFLPPSPSSTPPQTGPHPFVLEIGSEELPPDDLAHALAQLRTAVPELLTDLRLDHGDIVIDGTPRRQTVLIHALADRQRDLSTRVIGPPADRAFDADGNPTKAALGFARSKGIAIEALELAEEGGKRYVAALVHEQGRPVGEVLPARLAALVGSVRFQKSMRWNETNVSYSRPLRWLVALWGSEIIPFDYAGLQSGRVSRGLRPYDSPPIVIESADQYEPLLRQNGILLRMDERRDVIATGISALADSLGGHIPEMPALLHEVINLVECPTPFIGRFDDQYLALPAEILVAVMRKHQRYFPVYAADGRLLPRFIAVRNGDDQHLATVADGNEQVLRARFADADFFYKHDREKRLGDFLPDLAKLTFQADLGSMLHKTERLEKLTPALAQAIGLSQAEIATATRAAALAKADLASHMVVEMTSLQGIMGGHYARISGETEAVAAAIAEQYESVSRTRPGLALALADRLDSLVGLTAAGLLPKGANDPFALRRAAIQVIENVIGNGVSADLHPLARLAADLQPLPVDTATLQKVLDFITARLEVILREQGFGASVVRAVLAAHATNPYAARETAAALTEAQQSADWSALLDGYARCVRITRTLDTVYPVDPDRFAHAESDALYSAWQHALAQRDGSLTRFITSLRQMLPAISAFFDAVLVMDEDPAIRQSHLGLLQGIAALADGIADLSRLEGF